MKHIIFHIDVNSAFLSWEAVRRLKNGDIDIREIPSCIGGDPNSRKGVVLAKSIPAKKYNVRTGEPLSLTTKKCPFIKIVPPDFKLYSQCSKAFKEICRRYSPIIEEFSIDECFLDVTSECITYRETMALAYELKDTIKNELGFTVNIGITLSNLTKMKTGEQISFFNMSQVQKNIKDEKLDKIIDNLRRKYGSDIIKRGAIMTSDLDVAKKFKVKNDSEY